MKAESVRLRGCPRAPNYSATPPCKLRSLVNIPQHLQSLWYFEREYISVKPRKRGLQKAFNMFIPKRSLCITLEVDFCLTSPILFGEVPLDGGSKEHYLFEIMFLKVLIRKILFLHNFFLYWNEF